MLHVFGAAGQWIQIGYPSSFRVKDLLYLTKTIDFPRKANSVFPIDSARDSQTSLISSSICLPLFRKELLQGPRNIYKRSGLRLALDVLAKAKALPPDRTWIEKS
jgi:hypothetical protein